jgi:glycerophosphoryl diester phosphodiesterase
MNNPNILRIGHRGGAADDAPENTLAAIAKGISLGADYVEIDVQLTADQRLVVIHDKRIDRTTKRAGIVADLTLAELRALDAGKGERIPEFSEMLNLVNERVGLMAEIITPGIGATVASAVHAFGLRSPIIFASFLHAELLAVKSVLPQAKTLALIEGIPVGGSRFALEARASHVGLGFDSVTEPFVRELQNDNLAVFVYTLDDPLDIERARDMRVDGIISNYPQRI